MTTTTAKGEAIKELAQGFADAFGLADGKSCVSKVNISIADVEDAVAEYRKGGVIHKAIAMEKLAAAAAALEVALRPCSSAEAGVGALASLAGNLLDKRFYTAHNGLMMLVDFAEDHHVVESLAAEAEAGEYQAAGGALATLFQDVIGQPGLARNASGAAALPEAATGVLEGFTVIADNDCFKYARMELRLVVGAIKDITKGNEFGGIATLARALQDAIPLLKDCKEEKPEIENMIHTLEALVHPAELEQILLHDFKDRETLLDVSLNAAAAAVAYDGNEWDRFGREIGKLLARLLIAHPTWTTTPATSPTTTTTPRPTTTTTTPTTTTVPRPTTTTTASPTTTTTPRPTTTTTASLTTTTTRRSTTTTTTIPTTTTTPRPTTTTTTSPTTSTTPRPTTNTGTITTTTTTPRPTTNTGTITTTTTPRPTTTTTAAGPPTTITSSGDSSVFFLV